MTTVTTQLWKKFSCLPLTFLCPLPSLTSVPLLKHNWTSTFFFQILHTSQYASTSAYMQISYIKNAACSLQDPIRNEASAGNTQLNIPAIFAYWPKWITENWGWETTFKYIKNLRSWLLHNLPGWRLITSKATLEILNFLNSSCHFMSSLFFDLKFSLFQLTFFLNVPCFCFNSIIQAMSKDDVLSTLTYHTSFNTPDHFLFSCMTISPSLFPFC